MRPIILASGSPRRKKLLEQIGVDFTTEESQFDETNIAKLIPYKTVEYLSKEKAKTVAKLNPESLVIGMDTVVILENEIIGKPKSEKEARGILRKLSGRTHTVLTGITIVGSGKTLTRSEATRVRFKKLKEKEINAYIKTGEPMDKAGAYGIQERGALFVKGIQGEYSNVVGLPIILLSEMLKEFDIDIIKNW